MHTALYGKIKERRETRGEWWTKRTLPFNYSNKTQNKIMVCKVPIDEG